jgi:hypothetical protein
LLAPASDALTSPCLTGPITDYDWAEGIALMTIFLMFFIELLAARFDVFGEKAHDLEAADPSMNLVRQVETKGAANSKIRKGKLRILSQHVHFEQFSQALCLFCRAVPEPFFDHPVTSHIVERVLDT